MTAVHGDSWQHTLELSKSPNELCKSMLTAAARVALHVDVLASGLLAHTDTELQHYMQQQQQQEQQSALEAAALHVVRTFVENDAAAAAVHAATCEGSSGASTAENACTATQVRPAYTVHCHLLPCKV
jgi:hypothetical protein